MKKLLLGFVVFLCCLGYLNAQYLKLPIGKKFKVTIETNNITDITMMDQHMQMLNDMMVQSDMEIKAVTKNGFTLETTPKHMRMLMSMMGREQKIDTDSISDQADPLVVKSLEFINKPQSIIVEDGKITFRTKLADVNTMNNNVEDANWHTLKVIWNASTKTLEAY